MITTANLTLLPCTLRIFETLVRDTLALEPLLGVIVPENFTEHPEAIKSAYLALQADSSLQEWGLYLFLHTWDATLIGMGGFKGKPDGRNHVEIGFELSPEYRTPAIGAEVTQGLIDFAFKHPLITAVDVRTLKAPNMSVVICRRVGMEPIHTYHTQKHGEIWQWRISRKDYQGAEVTAFPNLVTYSQPQV